MMELWIRSQDKNELIPIKAKLKVYEGDLIQTGIDPYQVERHYNIIHNTDFLGEYKSKERSLEVLDEICDTITKNKAFVLYPNIGDSTEMNKKKEVFQPVYIMPKK